MLKALFCCRGLDLLIGLKFISIMRLVIDAENRRLYFEGTKSEPKSTDIRSSDNLVLTPKTQNIVAAVTPAIGTVSTISNNVENGTIVANSVSEVVKVKVNMVIVKPTNQTIRVKANTQLATFEFLAG